MAFLWPLNLLAPATYILGNSVGKRETSSGLLCFPPSTSGKSLTTTPQCTGYCSYTRYSPYTGYSSSLPTLTPPWNKTEYQRHAVILRVATLEAIAKLIWKLCQALDTSPSPCAKKNKGGMDTKYQPMSQYNILFQSRIHRFTYKLDCHLFRMELI